MAQEILSMFLRRLYLYSFRNIQETVIEFSEGMNVIYGLNAQGKTALLEAIYFLITGHSFRTPHLTDLILQGSSSFFLEANFIKHGIEHKMKVSFGSHGRKLIINSTSHTSFTHLLGLLQGVVTTPNDQDLIKGTPSIRRQFLDDQLIQCDPLYAHHLQRYQRAMKQRNHLLKARNTVSIESWEYELANSASYLIHQRRKLISDLTTLIQLLHSSINVDGENVGLNYQTSAPLGEMESLKEYYLSEFQQNRHRELELGYSLSGPHRDDVDITLSGQSIRHFASEGQQRGCVAILKLAEWLRLKDQVDEMPLMLIDDIGLGMDTHRRERISDYLSHLGQVFVTGVDPIKTNNGFIANYIHVSKGTLKKMVN